MGTISVLKTANLESNLQGLDRGTKECPPVSLLAFLQAENLKLRMKVAELQRDTSALRATLQRN
jgi:hypothetical protein